jgi:hypothetical protein
LKRDQANTELAEEAFLTAVAVAQQQKAKSFELRPRSCWQSFINRRAEVWPRTPCSHQRSKAFRRPLNSPRSTKRRRYSLCCRHEPIKGGGDFRDWPITTFRGNAALRSLLERNGHEPVGQIGRIGRA